MGAADLKKNAQHREALLKRADGVLSAAEVGHLLQLTRQAVDKRRRTGALLALRQGSGWRYPRCQFTDADTVPGLAEVVRGSCGFVTLTSFTCFCSDPSENEATRFQ